MSAPLALLTALAALASEDRVRFDVERDAAAEVCPSTDALAERVRARIGSEPFADGDDVRRIHVVLAGERRGLIARVQLFTKDGAPTGERTLRGARGCEELAEQLVLAVAIAIDPLLLLRPAASTDAARADEDATRSSTDAPVLDATDKRSPAPAANASASRAPDDLPRRASDSVVVRSKPAPREPPRGLALRALGVVTGGVAAPVAPGLRLGALYQGDVLSIEGSVRGALPARVVLGDAAGVVDVSVLTVQVAPGVALVGDVASLRGAIAVDAGALFARGVGLAVSRSATVPWLAVGARGGMDIVLVERLTLVIDGEGLVPLFRPRFVDGQTGERFSQAEGLAWTGAVGLAWWF